MIQINVVYCIATPLLGARASAREELYHVFMTDANEPASGYSPVLVSFRALRTSDENFFASGFTTDIEFSRDSAAASSRDVPPFYRDDRTSNFLYRYSKFD
uniref:Uncharacterized protein n=1 Tax=Paraburkholderia sprentiae WSM5005 TaxID=754502 RepID=A0A1I9YNP5_9BURK